MSAPHSNNVPLNRLPVTKQDLVDIGNFSHDSIAQPRNSFGGNRLYVSDIHDSLWRADDRYQVTGALKKIADDSVVGSVPNISHLFDGSYESFITIPAGQYVEVSIDFRGEPSGFLGGLPYGDLIVSFYFNSRSTDVSALAYSDTPTSDWRSLGGHRFVGGGGASSSTRTSAIAFASRVYQPKEYKIIVRASDGAEVQVMSIEFAPNRNPDSLMPVVSKYKAESLYERLSWVLNKTVTAYIDKNGSAKFGHITSPSLDAKQDKPTSGTASSTTYLRGDGTWAVPPNTNSTYAVPAQAEIEAGTATTARAISANALKGAIQRWATGTYTTAISAIGQALNRATTAAEARTAIGAGTSNLAIGTTASTAKAGNWTPTKAQVGLGNVDNTSDMNKPVSTAQQQAINAAAATGSGVEVMSRSDFDAITPDPDTTYIVLKD